MTKILPEAQENFDKGDVLSYRAGGLLFDWDGGKSVVLRFYEDYLNGVSGPVMRFQVPADDPDLDGSVEGFKRFMECWLSEGDEGDGRSH